MAKVHIVTKPLNSGIRYYVYAWRGGPCIHCQDHVYPVITQEILLKQHKARMAAQPPTKDGFIRVINAYRESPEFARLAESTQKEYSRWLDRAEERFGQVPVKFFDSRQIRGDIIEWRNLWADTPRAADMASMIMNILCGWALEQGMLNINVAAKIKNLHQVNRSDMIWEGHHWTLWNATKVPPQLNDAIVFDSLTGLRLGDLVEVTWDEVGTNAIVRMTNKGRRQNARAVIPILPDLRFWLEEKRKTAKAKTILTNSRGEPWTTSGLKTVFQRNKPEGFDRTIHDLRGTFCTKLILAGLTDAECAMVMGWTSKRVAEIRARYVNEERVILHIADRLSG